VSERLLNHIPVFIAKGEQAICLQGDDFFFLQPFDRFAKLFPEEFPAEADLM